MVLVRMQVSGDKDLRISHYFGEMARFVMIFSNFQVTMELSGTKIYHSNFKNAKNHDKSSHFNEIVTR